MLLTLCLLSLCAAPADAQSPTVIYVKKGGSGNGSSWAQAYPGLQQALTAASAINGPREIWVAAGEYKPSTGTDMTISFQVPNQTFLYGGFAGTETSKDTRNWTLNRTVLSGDLGGVNAYHVVVVKDISTAGIDGFFIKKGAATGASGPANDDSGGGLLVSAATIAVDLHVNNCEFSSNDASQYGGGLAVISLQVGTAVVITNSIFNGNTSAGYGGGIGTSGASITTVVNNTFSLNSARESGGAISGSSSTISVVNSTFAGNGAYAQSHLPGKADAIFTNASALDVRNSIFRKNTTGAAGSGPGKNIAQTGGTLVSINNVLDDDAKYVNFDPMFTREPGTLTPLPATSIIPVQTTNPAYEKQLAFSGPVLPDQHAYAVYMDHDYNKMYISGRYLQILDFNNPNGMPASTIKTEVNWGRIQRIEKSIHLAGNKLYFAAARSGGLVAVDRSTGQTTPMDPLAGEPLTYVTCKVQDIVIDNTRNLLYAPVFYWPDDKLYGLLELNLTDNTKRWITPTSTPVALAPVNPIGGDNNYWNGHRLFLNETTNILYYSMGNGVWWWNRNTNATGVYNTAGGIPLQSNNPQLPSNFTTGMYFDSQDRKFYIGTHAGLFVWDQRNNTSQVYNTQNSKLIHNLINNIDKVDETIYAACELGGVFAINTASGEQTLYTKGTPYDLPPALMSKNIETVYYDPIDKRLYIGTDDAGIQVKDFKDKQLDYGDLRLGKNSPAIDRASTSSYPSTISSKDLDGHNRFQKYYATSADTSWLDLGAFESIATCPQPVVDFQFTPVGDGYVFTPVLSQFEKDCQIHYKWNFGDGATSTEASPQHTYTRSGLTVRLEVAYTCGACPADTLFKERQLVVDRASCGSIFCGGAGRVGVATQYIPVNYALAVKGKVVIEGGKLAMRARWPDYVFEKTYPLMPLSELKQYIIQNGHLPEVPSAEEVKRDGIDVGEMSRTLLKKTEELTLHMLQIDQRLRKLEGETSTAKP